MNITILIGTCDKYQFLWKDFVYLFDKYTQNEFSNIRKVFMSETRSESIDGYEFFTPGKIPYSNALIQLLDTVDTDYVLWMQEDYFLSRYIPITQFEKYFEYVVSNSVDRFQVECPTLMESTGVPVLNEFITKGDSLYRLNQDSRFSINMQASIWNVEFFKSILIPNESPWQLEEWGSRRANTRPHHLIHHVIPNISMWYHQAMVRGKRTDGYWLSKKVVSMERDMEIGEFERRVFNPI